MTWRTLHNATALLVTVALLTAAPLALDLPRGLREPWVLAHVAVSSVLVITVPAQVVVGFRRLLRLHKRDGMLWLNGWFGRLLLPLVAATVLTGFALWQFERPGRHAWPVFGHRVSWQALLPTLGSHILISIWLRHRLRRASRAQKVPKTDTPPGPTPT